MDPAPVAPARRRPHTSGLSAPPGSPALRATGGRAGPGTPDGVDPYRSLNPIRPYHPEGEAVNMRIPRSSRPAARTLALAAALAALAPVAVPAQYQTPPPPAAYALTGLTVVQPYGEPLEGITVVVRGGLIEAMGPDVVVPADARVLEGEGLYLHPGIVDAWGDVDVAWADARDVEDDDDVTAWTPPRSRQGFMPARRGADES